MPMSWRENSLVRIITDRLESSAVREPTDFSPLGLDVGLDGSIGRLRLSANRYERSNRHERSRANRRSVGIDN